MAELDRNIKYGFFLFLGFISTVVLANWAVERYGIVPVGFGLTAPAAVYVVGIAFTLRDLLHEHLGPRWVIVGILIGAGLSAWLSPSLALASGVAFLTSELADLAIYTPLRDRGWVVALVFSNAVGIVVDSLIFLWLAFHSLEFLPGQLLGKFWMTLLAIVLLLGIRGKQNAILARST